jgi:protein phosphatase
MNLLHYGAATHSGKVRPMNQDSLYAGRMERKDGFGIHFFAVADGIGGYEGGDTASKIAIDTSCFFIKSHAALWTMEDGVTGWPKLLQEMLSEMNTKILEAAQEDPRFNSMGTTFTGVVEIEGILYMLHVGDSRLYHCDGKEIYQISSDHSWSAELVRSGQISALEAKNHPNRNVLTQSLGYSGKITAEIKVLELCPQSKLLLCSDGLFNLVNDDELLQALIEMKEPYDTAQNLVALANERGGIDNITVIPAQYLAEKEGDSR